MRWTFELYLLISRCRWVETMLLWSGFWVSQSCGHNAFATIVNLQTCFTSQYLLTESHTFATLTQSTVTTIQWTENLTPVGAISYH